MSKKYDWTKVDWNKNNGEIRRVLGCSEKLVGCKRKKLHQILSPWKPSYSPVDWKNMDWINKTAKQIAKETSRSLYIVYLHRRKLYKKPECDWANVNWSLSDSAIGKLLSCDSSLVQTHRKNLMLHYRLFNKLNKNLMG